MATTVGTIQLLASIDTSQYKKDAKDIKSTNKDVEKNVEKTVDKTNKEWAKMGAAIGAVSAVVQQVLTRVATAISSTITSAINRVDTLANSNRTFANMGFTAEATAEAMKALDQSIRGLPTPLNEAVKGVQLLSGATNDVSRAQKIFSALNNAVIGFGGSAMDVQGAIIQISQAFSNGRIDAQTWNSLIQNNLGPALNAMARQMGITTAQLKEGLSEGTISVEQFQDALISMNKDGGGGLKSFEQIARDATSGISTGWQNMQTAITRGIAKVIEAIGSENISSAITGVGRAFESGANFAVMAIDKVSQFFNFIRNNQGTIIQLATVITILLTPAIIRFGIQSAIAFQLYLLNLATAVAMTVLSGVRMAAALLLALGPIGVISAAIAAFAALVYMNFDTIQAVISSFWNWLRNSAASAWAGVRGVFSGVGSFFAGIFGSIVDIFRNVGTTVGNAIGGAFRNVINSILNGAANIINGFINAINTAIDTVNKIPGVSVGKLGTLSVPQLANGGIVTAPTLAMIGEGRESEAVIPLSKLDDMMNGGGSEYNIGTINIGSEVDGERWLRKLTGNQEITSARLVPKQNYM